MQCPDSVSQILQLWCIAVFWRATISDPNPLCGKLQMLSISKPIFLPAVAKIVSEQRWKSKINPLRIRIYTFSIQVHLFVLCTAAVASFLHLFLIDFLEGFYYEIDLNSKVTVCFPCVPCTAWSAYPVMMFIVSQGKTYGSHKKDTKKRKHSCFFRFHSLNSAEFSHRMKPLWKAQRWGLRVSAIHFWVFLHHSRRFSSSSLTKQKLWWA